MTEAKKSTGLEPPKGPFTYKVYCKEDKCLAVSVLIRKPHSCFECGSNNVTIQRDQGTVDEAADMLPLYKDAQLPDGANLSALLKGLGGKKKLSTFLGVPRDERGEGIDD